MLSRKRIFSFFLFQGEKKFFFSKMASGGKMLLWIFGNVWVAVIEWGLDQYISIPKKCFYMQMEFWSKVRLSHQILISFVTLKLWLVSWTYFYWFVVCPYRFPCSWVRFGFIPKRIKCARQQGFFTKMAIGEKILPVNFQRWKTSCNSISLKPIDFYSEEMLLHPKEFLSKSHSPLNSRWLRYPCS